MGNHRKSSKLGGYAEINNSPSEEVVVMVEIRDTGGSWAGRGSSRSLCPSREEEEQMLADASVSKPI